MRAPPSPLGCRRRGYRTALFGKYLNGYPDNDPTYIPPGWNEWQAVFNGHYISYEINENGRVVAYGTAPEDYETDVLSGRATRFIAQHAGDTPFFAYLAPRAPHGPSRPAPRHRNEFAGVTAPRARLPSMRPTSATSRVGFKVCRC